MLATIFHWLGFGLCHQLPARSLFAGGYQLPVCARDTGIYTGFVLSLVVISLLERGRRPSELPRAWVTGIAAVMFGAMVADGVSSYAGWRTTTNDLRLLTGLLAGYSIAVVVTPMLNAQIWRTVSHTRLLEGRRGAVWVLSLVPSFALLRWGLTPLGVGYPLLLTLAIIVTFLAVNLVFATLVPAFERRADRLRDAWLAISISLFFVFVELGLAAALRVGLEHAVLGGVR